MINKSLLTIYNELCIELDLESKPPVLLTEKDAADFVENHFLNRDMKISVKNVNGAFLYENLDEDYIERNNIDKNCIENGVICMVKDKKASLVHEMRHAYQLKNNFEYMFLEKNAELKREYKETYVYYPSEEDAFNYTLSYLKNEVDKMYDFDANLYNIIKYLKLKRKYFLYKLNYQSLKLVYYWRNKKIKSENNIWRGLHGKQS